MVLLSLRPGNATAFYADQKCFFLVCISSQAGDTSEIDSQER